MQMHKLQKAFEFGIFFNVTWTHYLTLFTVIASIERVRGKTVYILYVLLYPNDSTYFLEVNFNF